MKKGLVIGSLVLIVVSISLTVGMFLGKLSNSGNKEEEEKERKPKVEKKEESTEALEEPNDIKETEYLSVIMPDFVGNYVSYLADFVDQHGLTYEIEESISTSAYEARGLIANQSIEPGEKIEKDTVIKIGVYNFDEHYDPTKEADPCHDEYGNEIKTTNLDKSKYQSEIYDAQCMYSVEESYSAGDYILNEMWKDLKQSLPNNEFEALRNEQREWIEIKDNKSDTKEKAIMTLERCQYLIDIYFD